MAFSSEAMSPRDESVEDRARVVSHEDDPKECHAVETTMKAERVGEYV